jgi:hypothetical protein
MGQVLHGSATTTAAVRRAIQHSQESLRALARRYGVNPKTIAKWKERTSAADLPTGPKKPRSTVLSVEEEAMDCCFRGRFRFELGCFPVCWIGLDSIPSPLARSGGGPRRALGQHERAGLGYGTGGSLAASPCPPYCEGGVSSVGGRLHGLAAL